MSCLNAIWLHNIPFKQAAGKGNVCDNSEKAHLQSFLYDAFLVRYPEGENYWEGVYATQATHENPTSPCLGTDSTYTVHVTLRQKI